MNPDTVAKAIRGLYSAFGSVPKPRSIDACPCCEKQEDTCQLLEAPLDQVPSVPLSHYTFSAFLTAGSEADFRYFLPRILELTLLDKEWYADVEVVIPKLRLAHWETWPREEIAAVTGFLEASFEVALQMEDAPGEAVDSWLCGLALADVDLEPFQKRLVQPDARRALRELYDWNSHKLLSQGKLTNPFWHGHPVEMGSVASWLRSPEVQSRVHQQ
jgi:hypothetical protein